MKLIISKGFVKYAFTMLLFEKLTTFRAKLFCFLFFLGVGSVVAWLLNWFLLSVRDGWF